MTERIDYIYRKDGAQNILDASSIMIPGTNPSNAAHAAFTIKDSALKVIVNSWEMVWFLHDETRTTRVDPIKVLPIVKEEYQPELENLINALFMIYGKPERWLP